MADRVGQHIDDFRLIRLLGTGSFGEVYLGEHLDDRTLVAVKMLSLKQENLKEFVKEVGTTLRLKHPHIIHLQALGMSVDDIPYLIMDYAPNGTLRQRHTKGAQLPLDTIVSYLMPLAEALQYAHDKRVIHRDVKPDNVLIGQDGKVLLSDFGLALIAPIEQSLSTQNMAGTVPYMAPEQIRGKPLPASDQYALGIMAYEWLCGVRPFQGTMWEILNQHQSTQPPPLREMLPALHPMIEEIILKALAKDPQDRFARVLDFATALQQAAHIVTPYPPLSSLSLPLVLPPTDVSLQPEHTPQSAVLQLEQAPDMSAILQPKQVPSNLPSKGPLIVTNPTISTPAAVPPTISIFPSFSSSPISSPNIPQLMFIPSIPPAIRRGPTRRKLILFVGLLLLIIGSSMLFSLPMINSLGKFPSFVTTPTPANIPTPPPTLTPLPTPTIEPSTPPALPLAPLPLTVDITSTPSTVTNNTTVSVGATTNEPGASVALSVTYSGATPSSFKGTPETTNSNGQITLPWHISVQPFKRYSSVTAHVTVFAQDTNGQNATSQTATVQVFIFQVG